MLRPGIIRATGRTAHETSPGGTRVRLVRHALGDHQGLVRSRPDDDPPGRNRSRVRAALGPGTAPACLMLPMLAARRGSSAHVVRRERPAASAISRALSSPFAAPFSKSFPLTAIELVMCAKQTTSRWRAAAYA